MSKRTWSVKIKLKDDKLKLIEDSINAQNPSDALTLITNARNIEVDDISKIVIKRIN